MPYTTQEKRKQYKFLLQMLNNALVYDPADLSFLITQAMKRYMDCMASLTPLRWGDYSDVLKALDAAREAFMEDVYRPYEKIKKEENGGVFS